VLDALGENKMELDSRGRLRRIDNYQLKIDKEICICILCVLCELCGKKTDRTGVKILDGINKINRIITMKPMKNNNR
jgi:hypothetical protein